MVRELQVPSLTASSERWIAEARCGSRLSANRLFEGCFPYLLAVANRELGVVLRSRLDPVDVVQDTLMKAWRHFPHFRGQTEADWLAWLRQILRRHLANQRRKHLQAAMRSIHREVAGDKAGAMAKPEDAGATADSPDKRAQERERQEAFTIAFRRLPVHYRQALHLRTQEGLPFAEVGRRLDRSAEAARKLWMRAVKELGSLLAER